MAHVLVVDDDADVRNVVRRVVTKLGHRVWDVSDGQEALRLLETSAMDLIISDVYMADMDGMELLVRIRQLDLDVPVVVISGGGFRSKKEVLEMATACGAVATLDKPFTVEALRKTLEPLLPPPGKE